MKKVFTFSHYSLCAGWILLLTLIFSLSADAQIVSFTSSNLYEENLVNPTSLQFGPDGRLYVSQQNGVIFAYTIQRNGANDYQIIATEIINEILLIPNHNDDGTLAPNITARQVTGILVTGTAANPVLYVTSSDPRHGGTAKLNNNSFLDTNSGVISRLTWNGTSWDKLDLVSGLPRSEENHSINGMALDKINNILYLAQGGNTNMGAPSYNFVYLPEYALSTAILSIDLNAIGNAPYYLPTLDDEDRSGVNDLNDPFGGNNGKNQAMLVEGGPVQVYSSGWRNNYDLVRTESGKMYCTDNGPNANWGGLPTGCGNDVINNGGVNECDVLMHVQGQGFYAGHPNPTRANRANTFNASNPQSPVPASMENPQECIHYSPGSKPGQLASICSSTDGIAEYTATNFNGAMKGNLISASFNGKLYRFVLNATGDALAPGGQSTLASSFGSDPLDVIAQGDNDIFPGTIWAVTYGSGNITVLEPVDFPTCVGAANSTIIDSDNDGYKNADETANETDYCNPSSKPVDFDADLISDLLDPDDDNDGISDVIDRFPLDAHNGLTTTIPISYEFDNTDDGGIENWGFTGLMTNGATNYRNLYNPDDMTVGGASLKFTVDLVSEGDAFGGANNQEYGFQTGLNVGSAQWSYIVNSRVVGPFQEITPANWQSMGMFIGTGDQKNYIKIVCAANGGSGGIQVVKEINDSTVINTTHPVAILNKEFVDLFLHVDPIAKTVQPGYSAQGGAEVPLGAPIAVPQSWINSVLAVGIISTSFGPANPFAATWEYIKVEYDVSTVTGHWHTINSSNDPTSRHECSYVAAGSEFYLLGGRGIKPVQAYDPLDSTWANRAAPPVNIHHFQAVEFNGLIYAICAFTGNFPSETPLQNIYIYDPVGDKWTIGPEIPSARRRGSAGCVVYNNKIYVVCGITNGHQSGWVNWLDVYDPITNIWTVLPDAPRARDHFSVALYEDKIYAIGGRLTGFNGSTFNYTIPQVDVYDISHGNWASLPSPDSDLPTPRAAAALAVLGNEILVIGGESGQSQAHDQTEALNVVNNTWRDLASLNDGRHGSQAIVSNGSVYIAAGSTTQGSAGETNSQEVFYFFNQTIPTVTQITKGNIASNTVNKFFSLVALGTSKSSSITLTNSGGNQVLVVNEINLNDSTHFHINLPFTLPVLINPDQHITFDVSLTPTTLGVKNASIQIVHTGANPTFNIALSGECVESIPCDVYPTEESGIVLFEAESVPHPVAWENFTTISGYTGTSYLRYAGPDYYFTAGNNMISYKFNINHPGRYRFQMRSRQTDIVGVNDNDVWIKFPNVTDVRKYQLGADLGSIGLGWNKVYQSIPNMWNYQANTVEENPHQIYVDFSIPGTYEMQVSGRATGFMIDRFIFYKENEVTEASATTALPPVSILSCVDVWWYPDADGDLYGTFTDSISAPVKPTGYVSNKKDCDDTRAIVSPSATEIEDGLDNDCDGIIDEGFGPPKVLFVVGNLTLNDGDLAIKNRMQQLGMVVLVRSAGAVTTASANDMNLIFISATVSSADIGTKFTYVTVPLINCEPHLMDDLKMTAASTNNFGNTPNLTQVQVTGNPHPLAGGLANGTYSVYSAIENLVWGTPSSSGFKAVALTTDTAKAAVFGYETGSLMVGANAPARRVGFFLYDNGGSKITNEGLILLDATLQWAANYTITTNVTIGDALLVVGDTVLNNGDLAIKTRLETLGFAVTKISASASSTSSANGKEIVFISSTVTSTQINTKFTNVAVPLINCEASLSDDLKMTSSSGSSITNQQNINITGTGHALAAGLTNGIMQVFTSNQSVVWSNPNANAIKIATTASNSNATIYGYQKDTAMVGMNAPEKRVGFFLHDAGATFLTANGYKLFDAAVRWATLGINYPPTFNISGNVTVSEDFVGSQLVVSTPGPLFPGEESQVVTYSLTPPSCSFANVSINPSTGLITITAIPDGSGMQEFIITANDGQASNNTYTRNFTLTVNLVNDPPIFDISGNIIALKNFAGSQTVTVTPQQPVPANEVSQVVTYTLNPASVSFANVTFNSSTGQVSFTSKPDSIGFKEFTVTANDGQASNGNYSKTFFLAVNNGTSSALCFNCGGSQYISIAGDTFRNDQYFSGGTVTWTNNNINNVLNTFDDFVFISERNATNFSYNIPVANGLYKLKLYFAETYFGATGGNPNGGVGSRVFHITAQGTQVTPYFDIFAYAGGAEKAVIKEYDVIVTDGILTVMLDAVVNKPKLSGICITPSSSFAGNVPPTFNISGNVLEVKNFLGTRVVSVIPDPVQPSEVGQVVTYSLSPSSVSFANVSFNSSTGQASFTAIADSIGFQAFTLTANDGQALNNIVSRTFYVAVNKALSSAKCFNCGGSQFISVVGDTFKNDQYYSGSTFTFTNNSIQDIQNTYDDLIFKSERNANNFNYNIPVATGYYKVKLYFAETYFGATGGVLGSGAGSRIFNVSLEGVPKLSNFDIFNAAGGAEKAIIREFDSLYVSDGFITIALDGVINKPKISGICIVPIGANEPPSFTLSTTSINVSEDFTTPQTTSVIPDPVSPSDSGQIVTYSVSVPNPPIANAGINPNTGLITITALPNKNGSQVVTVTANDGQNFNFLYSRQFTINITPVNDPPIFTFSGSTGLPKNFPGSAFVQVVPSIVQPDETSQTVTYSLSPNSASFVNVSFDSTTGQLTFTSIQNAFGSQLFTVFANDHQPTNNLANNSFTLTVSQLGVDDPRPLFINCGGTQFISLEGDTFKADNSFTNGSTYTNNAIADILATSNDAIYKTERFATDLNYHIPVKPGAYDISLHFAEIFYGATGGSPANGGPGKRLFHVILEGDTILKNFDIWVAAGNAAAKAVIDTTFNVSVPDGFIDIDLKALVANAKISAISIRPVGIDCNNDANGSAYINTCGICVGGNTGFTVNQGKDCNGVCSGTAYTNTCGVCVGGTTGLTDNAGKDCLGVCAGSAVVDACGICNGNNVNKDCNGDCFGTAALDSCNVCTGGNTGIVPNSTCEICVPNEVVSLTLMHSGTTGEIGPFINGTIINLAIMPSFSVRANVCNNPVGSVVFYLNGLSIKTETDPPYAINGDNPVGSYISWNIGTGTYTLSATPYTGSGGTGTPGISETITFTVINQNIIDCNGVLNGLAYFNECAVCVGGNTGLGANQGKDCNGVCAGSALLDGCGICSGGNTGLIPNSSRDVCGVCFGNGSSCSIFINAGGPQFVSVAGDTFKADNYFSASSGTYTNNIPDILNTSDDVLFRTERNDTTFSYNIPVTGSLYKVKLYFAEIFYGATSGNPSGGAGSRKFNVMIEGNTLLTNYDVFVDAGGAERAIVKQFDSIAVADGVLNINFSRISNKAKISAIAVIPVSTPVPNVLPTVNITSPANNATFTIPANNITINAQASDADGSITKVEFYQNNILLGEDLTSPYSFSWNSIPVGNYVLKVVATDNKNATTTSALVSVSVSTNIAPVVSITSPLNSEIFNAPAQVVILANASDANGNVTKVEFYQGVTLLAADSASPYSFTWNNVTAGNYSLTAIAYDGLTSTISTAINIIVNTPAATGGEALFVVGNVTLNSGDQVVKTRLEALGFTVTLVSETASATSQATGKKLVLISSTVTSGNITNKFTNVAVPVINWEPSLHDDLNLTNNGANGTDANETQLNIINGVHPLAASLPTGIITVLTSPQEASYGLTGVNAINIATVVGKPTQVAIFGYESGVMMQGGLIAPARRVGFFIKDVGAAFMTAPGVALLDAAILWAGNSNQPPTVSITSPANASNFIAPANVTINANASDADGSIAKVEFYQGATLLGTDLVSPFSFSWLSAPLGNYALTAKAFDNQGGTAISAAINITVADTNNTAPTVSITSPANAASFNAPATIVINANAADANGTVTKVDFYQGATLLGTDNTSPYSFSWNNVPAGNYSLTAVATDNALASTTSAAINFSVVNTSAASPLTVNITSPINGAAFNAPATVAIAASVQGEITGGGAGGSYFQVTNTSSGYKQFQLGYNSTSIWVNPVNLTATGNTMMEITLRDFNQNIDWTKMQIKPATSSGGSGVTLSSYVTAVGGVGNAWKKITIPLSAFSAANFSSVNYFSIPNTIGAGAFVLGIQEVKFTGGATPFIYFGGSKTDNAYSVSGTLTIALVSDGGGGGALTASKVQFYNGAVLLGEDLTSPFSFNWTNVPAGSYALTAVVTDNNNAASTSSAVNIIVNAAGNVSPTVSITSPANAATFTAPATVTINANAADSDGSITKVEFYHGTTLLGEDLSSPYNFIWNSVAAGGYSLTAKATDNLGAVTTSAAISITVNPAGNVLPTVSITSPANAATFTAPATVTINANAADGDGSITKVEFYQGATLLGEDLTSPFSFIWNNVVAGGYSLTAKATDNLGAVTTSTAIAITVNPAGNVLPTISITSPANAATFTAPASVTINANAADSDGSISKVEFYQGATLLGEDLTSPYSFTWNSVAAGVYSLTAKATDNLGAVTTSTAIAITVNAVAGSTISVTSPLSNAVFATGTPITINTSFNGFSEPPYIQVVNNSTGYKQFRLANNSSSLWSPNVNASSGGNTTMQITFRNFNNNAAWDKFQIKAVGGANATLTLQSYVDAVGGIGNEWKTINIPMEAFTGVNFATLTHLVFYSNNAGVYQLGIREIIFTGGTTPFVYFGGSKTNNFFDVVGALTPSLQSAAGMYITKVEFYQGAVLLGQDHSSPYNFTWNGAGAGSYNLTAKATAINNSIYTSPVVPITVNSGGSKTSELTTIEISEETVLKNLIIYPNPSLGSFIIEFERTQSTALSIEIFNELGQKVYNLQHAEFKGLLQERVDLKNYASGIYVIRMKFDDELLTRKVVVRSE